LILCAKPTTIAQQSTILGIDNVADGKDDNTGQGEPPDLNALAREYLDLWQQQLAATADDDTLSKTMADAVRLMSAGAAQMATQTQAQMAAMQKAMQEAQAANATPPNPSKPSGPATAGASHRDDDGVLDELTRRLDALEERLGLLEKRLPKASD